MKNFYTFFVVLFIVGNLMAQIPQGFKYQAVARDASGDVVADQAVGMRISILQGSTSGTAVYVETFTPTTNEFGLMNLNIGAGTVVSGNLTTIDWGADTYFMKIEMDMTGGTTYEEYGTSQLLSVPYALYAKTASTFSGNFNDLISVPVNVSIFTNDAGYLTSFTETDPVFTAWDKSTGINITESQISDLDHFTTTDETDQIFTASVAKNITALDTTKWSNKVGTETDPTYTASEAAKITATNIANLGNLSGTNTGDQNLSMLALKTNVIELNNTAAFTPDADYEPATKKYVDDNAPTTYSVGDFAQGGIVFWVDETGQHGLICAKEDQGTGVRWYAGTYGDTRAYGDHINAGKMNTDVIIGSSIGIIGDDGSPYASEICKDLTLDGYSDWYLPSKEELNLMYENKATIDATADANGGSVFDTYIYWSSTESSINDAWYQHFVSGAQILPNGYNKNSILNVRAVRAF